MRHPNQVKKIDVQFGLVSHGKMHRNFEKVIKVSAYIKKDQNNRIVFAMLQSSTTLCKYMNEKIPGLRKKLVQLQLRRPL